MGGLCCCMKKKKNLVCLPIPPEVLPADASLVPATILGDQKKKDRNQIQCDLVFLPSSSLTPLALLSGGTPPLSNPGSPAKSTSNLSSRVISISSFHLSSEEGSQPSPPVRESCVSLTDSTLSSSDSTQTSSNPTQSSSDPPFSSPDSSHSSPATPPGLPCPSSPVHLSPSAPRCCSPKPLDHHGETLKDIENTSHLKSFPVKEVGAVLPQEKTVVPQIVAPAEASIDKRASSVSLERPYVRSGGPLAHLSILFNRRGTQIERQRCKGDVKDNTKLLGLPNIGNTCFMNSALQCLLELPAFCRVILRQQDIWSSYPSSKLLRCFAELQTARLSEGPSKSRTREKKKILKTVKSCLSIGHQDYQDNDEQDAHEFLVHLLCQLKEEGMALKESPEPYICPVKQLEFTLNTTRTCTSCGTVVFGQEKYNHLSLSLSAHLRHSLEHYFMPSPLECKCWDCSGSMASVSTHFLTLPRVLMLHVKRFCADDWEPKKVEDPMFIPEELTLQGLCGETVQPGDSTIDSQRVRSLGNNSVVNTPPNCPSSSASNGSDQQAKAADREKRQQTATVRYQPEPVYRLSSVISHLGDSLYTGHYITDLLDSHGSGWLCMDDARVRRTDVATVLRTRAHTAYILLYVCSGAGEGDQAPKIQN
ncbi:ubiquitin carboxyl-terminal hydrolase 37-like isoform X4 [Esox lucius]|nr:ubiquitin carboxyl-terminal hydrolase 37-like isoform X4 [Esox lucius]